MVGSDFDGEQHSTAVWAKASRVLADSSSLTARVVCGAAGDRYLLKLFRDFAFHQTSEDGAPVIDWGHVVEVLNKLDGGVPEKMLLLSRDETSMLVVSYADVKRCIEGAFNDLKTRGLAARQRSRNERQAIR